MYPQYQQSHHCHCHYTVHDIVLYNIAIKTVVCGNIARVHVLYNPIHTPPFLHANIRQNRRGYMHGIVTFPRDNHY